MDTLLALGDHCTDARGIPIRITGEEELLQRALLRLGIRRGSFEYDPSLGSELYRLSRDTSAATARTAQSYVQEALIPLPQITVGDVSLSHEDDYLLLCVGLTCGEKNYIVELKQ